MARRHWTVLLVRDEGVRQFNLSREMARVAVAAVLLIVSLLSSVGARFITEAAARLRAERLEKENALLASELATLQSRLVTLRGSLEELAKRDRQVRVYAGLPPAGQPALPPEPAQPTSSSKLGLLDPELGRRTSLAAYDLNSMLRRARTLALSWQEARDTLERKHDRLLSLPSIFPTRGFVVSLYSKRRWHPILDRPRPHEGIDISAPRGTPILAAARGRVTFVGWRGDYGLMVEVDHSHGYTTRYAHASRALVRPGQVVERGAKIGEVGDTGLAVGPHLHYEVLVHGQPENPSRYILEGDALPD